LHADLRRENRAQSFNPTARVGTRDLAHSITSLVTDRVHDLGTLGSSTLGSFNLLDDIDEAPAILQKRSASGRSGPTFLTPLNLFRKSSNVTSGGLSGHSGGDGGRPPPTSGHLATIADEDVESAGASAGGGSSGAPASTAAHVQRPPPAPTEGGFRDSGLTSENI